MKAHMADFISLLYPRVCINCNKGLTKNEEHLCLSCELSLPKSQHLTNKAELLKKFAFQPKVTDAYVFLDYIKDGIVQKLIHKLKYDGKQELGVWMGIRFGNEIASIINQSIDLILPIPLHVKRQRIRGYNQSDRIAEGMQEVLASNLANDVVIRQKETATQTRKRKLSRWENMRSVFKVIDPEAVKKKNILIVDDVITTGATLGVFCDELAKHDPESLTIAAVAAGK
ncbi:MAG: ComF family protein [Cytophagales bacterium]|nr:ComF family protein [Cytophagales bacterium]